MRAHSTHTPWPCPESVSKLSPRSCQVGQGLQGLAPNRNICDILRPSFLKKSHDFSHPPKFCQKGQKHTLEKDSLLAKLDFYFWRMKLDSSFALYKSQFQIHQWFQLKAYSTESFRRKHKIYALRYWGSQELFEQSTRNTGTNRWAYMEVKHLCPAKETLRRAHRKPGEWGKNLHQLHFR